jgi:outer membrane protein assembly factor BamB
LRAEYFYYNEQRGSEVLVEKEVRERARARRRVEGAARVEGDALAVEAGLVGAAAVGEGKGAWVRVNGEERELTAAGDGRFFGSVDVSGLEPGRHFCVIGAAGKGGRRSERALVFERAWGPGVSVRRVRLDAAVRAQPVPAGERVLVADTSGLVMCLTPSLEAAWARQTGPEIVRSLAAGSFVFAGDTDGGLTALRLDDGEVAWRYEAGRPVLAPAREIDGAIYFVDAGGVAHAVDAETGKGRWTAAIARFGAEAPVVCAGGVLYFGAWDGLIYAIDCEEWRVAWRSPGPTGHVQTKSRYYAPADCAPVVTDERLFICDRGYRLGEYGLDGSFVRLVREEVAAIGPAPDGGFYARGRDDRLLRYDGSGGELWSAAVPLGRTPAAPAATPDLVAAVSDTGLLTILEGKTGKPRARVRITPHLFVHAAPAWWGPRRIVAGDADGVVSVVEVAS